MESYTRWQCLTEIKQVRLLLLSELSSHKSRIPVGISLDRLGSLYKKAPPSGHRLDPGELQEMILAS